MVLVRELAKGGEVPDHEMLPVIRHFQLRHGTTLRIVGISEITNLAAQSG